MLTSTPVTLDTHQHTIHLLLLPDAHLHTSHPRHSHTYNTPPPPPRCSPPHQSPLTLTHIQYTSSSQMLTSTPVTLDTHPHTIHLLLLPDAHLHTSHPRHSHTYNIPPPPPRCSPSTPVTLDTHPHTIHLLLLPDAHLHTSHPKHSPTYNTPPPR